MRRLQSKLEQEKLVLDKERAGIANTQRELAHDYKELATLRIQVQNEKADLSRKRKIEETANEDMQAYRMRLVSEIMALEQEQEGLRQRVSFLRTRVNEIGATSRSMLLQRVAIWNDFEDEQVVLLGMLSTNKRTYALWAFDPEFQYIIPA